MDLNKAISIMKLNKNFTETDVKKSFKALSAEYNPNIYKDDTLKNRRFAEEMNKEINMARDYLHIYLNNDSAGLDLINFKFKIVEDLFFEMLEINKLKDNKDRLVEKYKYLLYNLVHDTRERIPYIKNKSDILMLCDSLREKYSEYLVMYYNDLCFSTGISFDINDIKYMSLKNLRDLFKKMIMKILHREMIKYSCYENYNLLFNILLIFRNAYIKVCLYGYMNFEEAKKQFNMEVLNEFKNYNKRKDLLENLKKYNKLNGIIAPEVIRNLEKDVCDPFDFSDRCLEIKNENKVNRKIRGKLNRQIKK